MATKKKDNSEKELLNMSYDDFLEILKMEIGVFFRFAENGKVVRYQGLKARKQSMRVRKLLKLFRTASVNQDLKSQGLVDDDLEEIDDLESDIDVDTHTGYPDEDLF